MTQEQIDSIRERMCDWLCSAPYVNKTQSDLDEACAKCPLNELEASE